MLLFDPSLLMSPFNILLQHFPYFICVSHETAHFVIMYRVLVTRHQTLISFSWQGVSFQVKGRNRLMMVRRRVVAELRDRNPHYRDTLVLKSTWQPSPCVQLVSHTRAGHPHRAFPRHPRFHRCLFVRSLFPMPPLLMSKQQLMLFLQGWGDSAAPSAGRPRYTLLTRLSH